MRSDFQPSTANEIGAATVSVDGFVPTRIVEPATPGDIADFLAGAASEGLAVAPVGGATSLALGNLPDRLDFCLSTARLRGIIEYQPTDLTLSVAAGSPLADVQAVLAEHGQTLPIEVPHPERATIGGLIATALAGPRRYGAGTLRDLLIGISAAHPSGTVTKAGGLVVKNVTGFDLMRLYLGSLGTLGVVVSANFKVLPLPRFESTLLAGFRDLDGALEAARRVRVSRVQPVALEITRHSDGSWLLATRIEGREATVRLLVIEARRLVATDANLLESRDSTGWWRQYVTEQELSARSNEALIRCTCQPSAIGTMVGGAVAAIAHDISLKSVWVSPGLGTLLLRVRFPIEYPAQSFLAYRDPLFAVSDHVVVLAADPAFKRGIDVWGKAPETIDVMRAIKKEFDPHRVLNPGRFAGHL